MKQVLIKITWVIDSLSRWTERIGSYLILPMIGVVFWEVISRRFFNSPTVWSMDILGMLFGVYIVWSGGPSVLAKSQVCMDALVGKWSPRSRAIVDCVTYTLTLTFCFVLVWQTTLDAMKSWEVRELANNIIRQPLYHWRAMLAAGTWLLSLQFCSELIKNYWLAFTGETLLDQPEGAEQ